MIEFLLPLNFPPGFVQNGTDYQQAGRWAAGQLVRFYEGTIRPVGGWERLTDTTGADVAALTGVPRGAASWRSKTSDIWLMFATTQALSIFAAQTMHDVTPVGLPAGAPDSTSGGAGGAYNLGPYNSGPYNVGALTGIEVPAATWTLAVFGEWLAGVCTSDKKLYIWKGDTGVKAATPAWGPLYTGVLVTSGLTASGAASIALTATTLTGTILSGQRFTVNGTEYVATDDATAAANILTVPVTPTVPADIPDATAVTGDQNQAPLCNAVVVTPEQFLVALGADGDGRLVRWASQTTVEDWGILATNSAGSFPLTTNGVLQCGVGSKTETLLWTDVDMHRMTYIGGTLLYSFAQVGDNCGIISPRAFAMVDATAYWMGRHGFFAYDGYVKPLPCDVQDAVFGALNDSQRAKVWAEAIPEFGEIRWHYPAGNEVDSYVTYNYREGHWATGTMARTAGVSSGVEAVPIMADPAGLLWRHEVGSAHPGATAPFIQSGPIEIGAGDLQGYGRRRGGEQMMKVTRLVPDADTLGDLSVTVLSRIFPTDTPLATGPIALARQTDFRVTCREVSFRFDEVTPNDWRLGIMRVGFRLAGRR